MLAGTSQHKLGEAAACAVKRTHLDERISRCAARTGAEFKEGFEVIDTTFDEQAGLWKVKSAKVCASAAQLYDACLAAQVNHEAKVGCRGMKCQEGCLSLLMAQRPS